ncbi:DUF7373 family lipoprotein [Tsukamurella spumae]|uniref:Uncharacterized protein n=1 Tax=Tsukamurella spumae TaxID=44753 RepID=A0A846WYM4_9ACTN|nr:hypothetical protein [Tsukamurella spumae]NKY17466.1 hypothetical protein [Tsukamurella spumae]
MKKPMVGALVAVLVSAGALAGCATTIDGTAVADPSAEAIRLDHGNFSVDPRVVKASAVQRKVLAANILTNRMVFPWDVDPEFTVTWMSSAHAVVQASNLTELKDGDDNEEQLGVAMQKPLTDRSMVYGMATSRIAESDGSTRYLNLSLIRMPDDAAAAGAVDDYRRAIGAEVITLPGVSGAAAMERRIEGKDYFSTRTTVRVLAAAGSHVIVVAASDKGTDGARVRGYAQKAIAAQQAQLRGFTSPGPADLAGLPVDHDGIVSHTVAPEPIDDGRFQPDFGFRESRAALAWMTDPVDAARRFEEAGVDLVGVGRNNVYRAADPAGAAKLADHLASRERGASRRFSIDGLPTARCVAYKASAVSAERFGCYVPVGRYVSEFHGEQRKNVEQVSSAAYLLLRRM